MRLSRLSNVWRLVYTVVAAVVELESCLYQRHNTKAETRYHRPDEMSLTILGRRFDSQAWAAFTVIVPTCLSSFVGPSYVFRNTCEIYHKWMISLNVELTTFVKDFNAI